jgi:xanthine dehydrogenase accessory factor
MSFSHAEDLEILAQCLQRAREKNDLAYIGLIGSKTKWATFRHRLEARGLQRGRLRARDLPHRRAGHRGQTAGGDCGGGGGAAAAAPEFIPFGLSLSKS